MSQRPETTTSQEINETVVRAAKDNGSDRLAAMDKLKTKTKTRISTTDSSAHHASPPPRSITSDQKVPGVSEEVLQQLLGSASRTNRATAPPLPLITPVVNFAENALLGNLILNSQTQMNAQVLAACSLAYSQQMQAAQLIAQLTNNQRQNPFGLGLGALSPQFDQVAARSAQLEAIAGMQQLQQQQDISASVNSNAMATPNSSGKLLGTAEGARYMAKEADMNHNEEFLIKPKKSFEQLEKPTGDSSGVKPVAPPGIPVFESLEQRLQAASDGACESFPSTLHRLLRDLEENLDDAHDVAYFLPDGNSFMIVDTGRFEKEVMHKYFPRMGRYSSFQRQLNFYGFQRISQGPSKGAYYHKYFVKQFPLLSRSMKRAKRGGSVPKSS